MRRLAIARCGIRNRRRAPKQQRERSRGVPAAAGGGCSQQAPPGKCLGSALLSYKFWDDVGEVCVVMGVGNLVWVDQYVECDEIRDPTVRGRDLTNVGG
jgi:hypothetical protein